MPRRLLVEAAVLILALLVAIGIRLFLFAVYSIPSESMLPRLRVGDYVLVAKWPYGWSGDGGPLARHLWRGRLSPRSPGRGDIVIFKAPPAGREDYVKRVIGLPGDRVAMRGSVPWLNGAPALHRRIADLLVPVTPNSPCRTAPGGPSAAVSADGMPMCRYPRFMERLPGGREYPVLQLAPADADDLATVTVPPGRLFVLGDNRDRSADSRFPAREHGGVGMVPADNLVGRPILILFSTDGAAVPLDPISWWRALRRDRTLAAL